MHGTLSANENGGQSGAIIQARPSRRDRHIISLFRAKAVSFDEAFVKGTLRPVTVVRYVSGLLIIVIAVGIKVGTIASTGPGYEVGHREFEACALLFLCALASARMVDTCRN